MSNNLLTQLIDHLPFWASMTAGSTLSRSSLTKTCLSRMTRVCSAMAFWISWDVTFLRSASCWSFNCGWGNKHGALVMVLSVNMAELALKYSIKEICLFDKVKLAMVSVCRHSRGGTWHFDHGIVF